MTALCGDDLFQKASGDLGILCHFCALPQTFYLGYPGDTFPHLHKVLFLWFSVGLDLPRFDWMMPLTHTTVLKNPSMCLWKVASAIWILKMGKKRDSYRPLLVPKVGLSWVACLSVSQVNKVVYLAFLILAKSSSLYSIAFPSERGTCAISTNTVSSEVCTLSKTGQFSTP